MSKQKRVLRDGWQLTGTPVTPEAAVEMAENFELENAGQVLELFGILQARYGRKPFSEDEFGATHATYKAALALFRLRLRGLATFEVDNPLDFEELFRIQLQPLRERPILPPDGLTLIEMNERWLLVGARGA